MKKVSELCAQDSRPLIAISCRDNLQRAARLMSKHHVGALPVLSSSTCVGGILSRHDLLAVLADGLSLDEVSTGDSMSKEVIAIPETETLEYAVELMRRAHVKHLPITRGAEVVGVASWGPLVFALEEDRRFELRRLEEYAFGQTSLGSPSARSRRRGARMG